MDYKVVFYENEYGKAPAYDFIKQLAPKQRAKVEGVLKILEEKGPSIREPYSKHLGEGLYELRCMLGGDAVRVLYFLFRDRIIVLTNGFIKKSAKAPRKELEKAKRYMTDFLSREWR
jgi:phage-related protein